MAKNLWKVICEVPHCLYEHKYYKEWQAVASAREHAQTWKHTVYVDRDGIPFRVKGGEEATR